MSRKAVVFQDARHPNYEIYLLPCLELISSRRRPPTCLITKDEYSILAIARPKFRRKSVTVQVRRLTKATSAAAAVNAQLGTPILPGGPSRSRLPWTWRKRNGTNTGFLHRMQRCGGPHR